MKKLLLAAAVLGFSSFAFAQDESLAPVPPPPPKDNHSEEIIIRNKGDKDMNMTVQINGDSVYVNGKPLNEFVDSQVSIRKRKMMMRDGGRMDFDMDRMQKQLDEEQRQWGNTQKKYYEQWHKNSRISSDKPFLGVTTEKTTGGTKVTEVVEGSAAEKAGLKEGDVITKVGDTKIGGPEELSKTIGSYKPKDEIKIYYKRDGKEKNLKAVLGERKEERTFAYSFQMPEMPERPEMPEMPEAPEAPEMQGFMNHDFGMMPRQKKIGLKIQDTEDGMVKVIDVEDSSAAAKAGILKDDIITEINGEKIDNTDEARDQLHPEEGKNAYNIKVKRNGTEMNFTIKIPKKLKTADL